MRNCGKQAQKNHRKKTQTYANAKVWGVSGAGMQSRVHAIGFIKKEITRVDKPQSKQDKPDKTDISV
jgi:hypothetical protein